MEVEARPRALSARGSGRWQHVLRFLVVMGPGIITANVDNDAGGITTYSLAGARYGYALVWTLVPITIALVVVQEMCARMGAVTGKGLADLIRENFGVRLTFYVMVLLLLADLGNTVAEFAGVAASLEIFGLSRYATVPPAAVFVWWLVVYGSYRRVEKVFLAACLFYLAYVASGGVAIETAADAAQALRPLAGAYCAALFAFGLFNASLFSASVLPLATAYSVCEALGWETGVNKRMREAPHFYGLYTGLIVLGAAIVLVPGIPLIPVMYLSQVANGVLLPVVLVFMLLLINRRDLMGQYTNGTAMNAAAWVTVIVTSGLSLYLAAAVFFGTT